MGLKRSEKKALRERVRKQCAQIIYDAADHVVEEFETQEMRDLVRTEMQSVAQRIDPSLIGGGGDA